MHGKRQVKSPKVLIRDSGMLHALLGCGTARELRDHPKHGASWEGYALESLIQRVRPDEAFFWATQNRAELDLMLVYPGNRSYVLQDGISVCSLTALSDSE